MHRKCVLTPRAEPEELVKAKTESKEVTELQPNKKYEFCLVAFNEGAGQSTVGNEVSLTTEPAPPKVDSQSASANSTEATLEAQVNPNNQETHAHLQYSTSAAVNGSGALTTPTELNTVDLGEGYGDSPVGPETLTPCRPARRSTTRQSRPTPRARATARSSPSRPSPPRAPTPPARSKRPRPRSTAS